MRKTSLRSARSSASWTPGATDLATWLHRVTVNAVLPCPGRGAYRPEPGERLLDSFANAGENFSVRTRSDSPTPRRSPETSKLIERVIVALPPIYRVVFVLSDVGELTNPEIAELLGLVCPL
jgi:DNA-directed RNA polymerase specialized sigma24 family protein